MGGSSDRGHLWPHGLLRPDPGEPPAKRPTSATPQEIEFVPQVPTRWLEPKLLMLIAVQVALSTKFAEFFDRRDAHAHLPEATQAGAAHGGLRSPDRPVGGAASASRWSLTETAEGFDFTGTDELWLDYVADSGDGFDATTTIAALAACDRLNLPDPAGAARRGCTRRGRVRCSCWAGTRPTRSRRWRSTATGWSARSAPCCRGRGIPDGCSRSRATTTGTTVWRVSSSSSVRAVGSVAGAVPRRAAISPSPCRTTGTCGRSTWRWAPTSTPASSTTSKSAPGPCSRERRSCSARPSRPGPPRTTTTPPLPTSSSTSSAR